MSHIDDDDQEEKPLDEAMERVRRKMVKLQFVSGGIMLLMFMAVLAAIVYKVTRPDPAAPQLAGSGLDIPSDQPIVAAALLPKGFTVLSTDLSGNRILFYGTTVEGTRKAYLFDLSVGRMVGDVTVASD